MKIHPTRLFGPTRLIGTLSYLIFSQKIDSLPISLPISINGSMDS